MRREGRGQRKEAKIREQPSQSGTYSRRGKSSRSVHYAIKERKERAKKTQARSERRKKVPTLSEEEDFSFLSSSVSSLIRGIGTRDVGWRGAYTLLSISAPSTLFPLPLILTVETTSTRYQCVEGETGEQKWVHPTRRKKELS